MGNLRKIIEELDAMIRSSDLAMAEAKIQEAKDKYHAHSLGLANAKGLVKSFLFELDRQLSEMEYWKKAYPYKTDDRKDLQIKLLRSVIGEEVKGT